MKHYFLLLSFIFSYISCKPQIEERDDLFEFINGMSSKSFNGKYIVEFKEKNRQPVFLKTQDPQCTQDKVQGSFKNFSFTTAVETKETNVTAETLNTSKKTLENESVFAAVKNYHTRNVYTECIKKGPQFECNKKEMQIVSPGVPISICREGFYLKDSIENIAIQAVYGVSRTYQRLASHYPPQIMKRIPKVRILVSPKIETQIHFNGKIYTSYQTDNAQWRHYTMDNYAYSILLFPHSEEFIRNNQDYVYYSQLAVIGHEYAHHIFEYMGYSFFQNQQIITSHSALVPNQSRHLSSLMVRESINEMYADFIAYMVFHSDQLSGKIYLSPYQKSSRHISHEQHDNQEKKILSFQALETFFSPYSKPTNSTNYQDVHILGATIGYALLQFFLSLKEPPFTQNEMIKLATMWVQNSNQVAQKYRNSDHPYYFLEDLIEEWIKLGLDQKKILPKKSCDILEEYFPVFYPSWRIKQAFSCKMEPTEHESQNGKHPKLPEVLYRRPTL